MSIQGAANVVYRLGFPDTTGNGAASYEADLHALPRPDSRATPPPSEIDIPFEDPYAPFRNHLLRLRKTASWILNYADLHDQQIRLINPLFNPGEIVSSTLMTLPPGLVAGLNQQLVAAAAMHTRPEKRQDQFLVEDEPHGLLVTDMSPRRDSEILIEIKPKWLLQSPNAPRSAKRCRTCALRARKTQKLDQKNELSFAEFCPLNLVSGDAAAIRHSVAIILAHSKPMHKVTDAMTRKLVARKLETFFQSTSLLPHLKALQERFDPRGILGYSNPETELSREFLIATTLRDCALFMRVPLKGSEAVEMRLGDLDLKSANEDKIKHWTDLERSLIEEGWYEGRGEGVGCRLE